MDLPLDMTVLEEAPSPGGLAQPPRPLDRFAAAQRRLTYFNRRRLQPGFAGAGWREDLDDDRPLLHLEGAFIEEARRAIAPLVAAAPTAPGAFAAWFEHLRETGPGQGDALFPWLAGHADRRQMVWFLEQEVAGEAGFEDLVAMTQVKLPQRAKLEMARNYWDEMGQGNALGMHGPLLERLSRYFGLAPAVETTVAESLALGNMMIGLALNRRYTYQSVGALGVIELTAPTRAGLVNDGLRRLGVPAKERNYFALHAALDVKHSAAWNREVIATLVGDDPRIARAIAEGALLRLTCGAACFARYRREFGLPA